MCGVEFWEDGHFWCPFGSIGTGETGWNGFNTIRNIQSHQKRSNFITDPDLAFINDINMTVKIILAAGNRVRN
jgi:hypothetical protein